MTETPLTADELDDVRDYHREHGSCYQCNTGLTCVTQRWLATIAALRTQLEQAQQDAANLTTDLLQAEARETALREALAGLVAATESERNPDRSAAYKKAVRALSGEGR